jgi:hypothetical protein
VERIARDDPAQIRLSCGLGSTSGPMLPAPNGTLAGSSTARMTCTKMSRVLRERGTIFCASNRGSGMRSGRGARTKNPDLARASRKPCASSQ